MRFQVLGAIRVTDGDEEIELGARRQQSLLALLLAHANEVVSTDRILDHLWGDDADGKENALWVYISRLRSTLEPDRSGRGDSTVLLTRPPGYLLSVEPDDLDAAEFEALVETGRAELHRDPATARRALADALALWRGPAYAGFDEESLRGEIERLEEMRVRSTEDRIDADFALGRDGELVPEIEALRRQHPVRERPVGQLMRCLYRSGRAADALRVFDRFRRSLADELGIDPSPELRRLEEQILLHDERLRPRPVDRDDTGSVVANPFKGLRPFVEDDAADFHGRSSLVADLVRAISDGQRLIALVGSSGSGKSSVVRAGLIPALYKSSIVGSDGWQIAYMVPAAHPFAEIEAGLLRSTLNGPDSLSEQLRDTERGLLRAALRVLDGPESRLVLVIDQFEELYTSVDDDVRRRFLSNLVTLLDDPLGRVTVVITLRADFYGEVLGHPAFGARLSGSVINVTPLSTQELAEAATEPLRDFGIGMEPALLAELTNDVVAQPGALPLFQYALTELFDSRRGPLLTSATYHEIGGLSGALARQADELYDELGPVERAATQQLFLRLVTITDGEQYARRRVAASELVALGVDKVAMQHVIGAYGRHRLLSFDADRMTASPTVEVAHEALLTAWPRFDEWIRESHEDVRRQASLAIALREWELSECDPDYLLTGARLAEFEAWAPNSALTLTTPEVDYIDASRARRDAEVAAAARHLDGERRTRRRLWALVGVLAISLAAVALILTGVFAGDRSTIALFVNRNDDSWNANIAAGVDRAAQDFDLEVLEAAPTVDPAAEMLELADRGPRFVISDFFGLSAAPEVFDEYPDIQFGLVDGAMDLPNVTSVRFANHEGAFLAGAAAAMKTETGTIGYLGGSPAIVGDFQAGFEAGAHWIDPDVEVLATYVEGSYFAAFLPGVVYGFNEPRRAKDRATDLYELGADVVFHAAGASGWGLFDAVTEWSDATGDNVWAIGVDNDQWYDVEPAQRPHVLTSMIKRGDTAAYGLVKAMATGDGVGGQRTIGMDDGAFTYSKQGDGLTPEMIETLDRIVDDIAAGRIVVPSQPTGEVLNLDPAQVLFEEGAAGLTREEIGLVFETLIFGEHGDEAASICSGESAAADLACATFSVGLIEEWRRTQ